jgi:hypothetical protein
MSAYKINLEIIELESKNFHVFIDLKVNDIQCRLLLDTGASKTVFDTERVLRFIDASKVKANESKSVGLGVTEMETKVAKIPKWQMGKLNIKQFKVAILPLAHVNQTYRLLELPPIDGVLGSDFLMKYNAIINYPKSILKLSKLSD